MNAFDYYRPDPALHCPVCHAVLKDWRGEDGPNAYLTWQQGRREPVDGPAGAAAAAAPPCLPVAFRIRTSCCSSRFLVEAIGRAPGGTWVATELITASEAQRGKDERMEDFKARLRWLQGGKR